MRHIVYPQETAADIVILSGAKNPDSTPPTNNESSFVALPSVKPVRHIVYLQETAADIVILSGAKNPDSTPPTNNETGFFAPLRMTASYCSPYSVGQS